MPPPLTVAVLPLTVLLVRVSVPLLLEIPPPKLAELSLTPLLFRDSVPSFKVLPPLSAGKLPLALPCRMVRSETATLLPLAILKTRDVASADDAAAWMMLSPEPTPVRVRFLLITSSVPKPKLR